jgi:hypothetical protein
VRKVHYRNQPVKIIKEQEDLIVQKLGFCSDKDIPLEVMHVPKDYADFDNAQLIYNKIGAFSNLIFSKYFINYFGFDDSESEYFFEIIKGTSLKKVLCKTEAISILDYPNLFKYWARETLLAFRDLAYTCNYQMDDDIELKNVFIADVGIKLFFKNERYGNPKKPGVTHHIYYEALLLRNYAKLMTEMVVKISSNLKLLDPIALIDPELRCILNECFHSLERLEENEEKDFLSKKSISDFIMKRNRELQERKENSLVNHNFSRK